MPLYEYLCDACDGIFEVVRPMQEAGDPCPCPLCATAARRLMPSAFTAFVMRRGYPRRLPDKGTFWHLGKEVSYLPKRARPHEHPQLKQADDNRPPAKQDREDQLERRIATRRVKREEQRRQRALRKDATARQKNARQDKARQKNARQANARQEKRGGSQRPAARGGG